MGLPQIDFRVPEATWLKSALSGRFGAKLGALQDRFGLVPSLRGTGALAWPYKIAVVAVMALVACGTLVTFGSAGAETPESAQAAALPGSDEASPTVEGQVLPPTSPSPSLLNSQDLLATLNLTDYSPDDTTLSLSDDDDEDSDEEAAEEAEEKAKAAIKKRLAAAKPTPAPSKTTSAPTPSNPSSPSPTPSKTTAPPEPVEGPKHQAWVDKREDYQECLDKAKNDLAKGLCNFKNPGAEPDFES